MRRALVLASVLLGLTVAGCDPLLEQRYYREGIGNGLYWPGLPEATRLQQLYIGYICEQAGIPIRPDSGVVGCDDQLLRADHWATFVQAGMNDIDLRCDSYLAWLDDKKRTTQPILKQINDVSVVTQSILRIAGVGADPITIVGLAFGLAADTFTNVRSRLLLEVNHSTVQTVVLARQREYRALLLGQRIDNRPAAIHALRSYLRLCMPFTIEMEINNTVVVFERGGAGALREPPLITPATVGQPALPRQQVSARDPISMPGGTTVSNPRYREIIEGYNSAIHTRSLIEPMLLALCAPPNEARNPSAYTKNLIYVFELYANPGEERRGKRNRKLDQIERSALSNATDCVLQTHKNYFEVIAFPDGSIPQSYVDLFAKGLSAGQTLPPNPTLSNSRKHIALIRNALGDRLETRFDGFADQVTPDMIAALRRSN